MAGDLPLYKSDRGPQNRRTRSNKRLVLALAAGGILFLLFLSARINTSSSFTRTPADELSTRPDASTVLPSPAYQNPSMSSEEEEVEEEEPGFFPVLQDNTSEEEEEQQQKPSTAAAALSPHSDHHSKLPHPWDDEASEDMVIINNSNHYSYIVIIASPASAMSRRNLIREKYFGLPNNLIPCMRYNADVLYKFWIYGGPPKSDTPERRRYEAEKMEWNDLEEVLVEFNQLNILEWAESTLAGERGITYDYLIVQDIYSFVHLPTIKRELDNGVISENTESPVTVNANAPTNLVWGTFGGQDTDRNAFIIGAAAAKLALEKKDEITQFNASTPHLLSAMYEYYQSFATVMEDAANAEFVDEPEAAAEIQEQAIPLFVREDGPEETNRFIRWENNVESVHAEDSVVTHIYQDDEFAELARWTYLEPVMVCHTQKRTGQQQPASVIPLDDDEDVQQQQPAVDGMALTTNHSTLNAESSIAVLTSSYIYDYCMEPSATLAAANKRKYAERHGHAFVARSAEFAQQQQQGRKAVWGKIDAVEKVLPKYDWIFWMDMDAVIVNQERSLFTLLDELRERYPGGADAFDENVHLIASRPTRDPMVNAGVFFLRNSAWSMKFLRDLQGMTEWYNKGSAYEQGAMWDLMRLPENEPHVFLLDRDDHTFNTFPRFYKPGDFVVHFAPDKCPNAATLKGLDAARRIEQGEVITSLDEE